MNFVTEVFIILTCGVVTYTCGRICGYLGSK